MVVDLGRQEGLGKTRKNGGAQIDYIVSKHNDTLSISATLTQSDNTTQNKNTHVTPKHTHVTKKTIIRRSKQLVRASSHGPNLDKNHNELLLLAYTRTQELKSD